MYGTISYLLLGRFIQRAIGPSSVCVGSSVIFNCTIEIVVSGINVFIDAQWRRDGVVITNMTPHHTLLQTQPRGTPIVTGVMVDSTTLDDNGIVYTCTAEGAPDDFTSNVTLNVTGGASIATYVCTVYIHILTFWHKKYMYTYYVHTYIRK